MTTEADRAVLIAELETREQEQVKLCESTNVLKHYEYLMHIRNVLRHERKELKAAQAAYRYLDSPNWTPEQPPTIEQAQSASTFEREDIPF